MNYHKIYCTNHLNRPVVNKKYKLCLECNYKRLHEGESQQSVYKKRGYKLKQFTSKRAEREKELRDIKSQVVVREAECSGCRCSRGLTNSHILSIKQREDLMCLKENIQPLCMSCHADWESWSVERMIKLECFEENMKFIERYDDGRFWRYMYKIIDYLSKNRPTVTVVRRIELMYFYNLIKSYVK